MAALWDTKPRFRAETERGRFRRGRRDASYRYEDWAKGPVVPNSVVVDIWDDHPFRNLWDDNRPGELAILQGSTVADWRRMLHLMNEFITRNVGGQERLVEVDEGLDFTSEIPSASNRETTQSHVRRARVARDILACSSQLSVFTVFRPSSETMPPVSPFSTCEMTQTCNTSAPMEYKMLYLRKETTCSASGKSSEAESYQLRSLEDANTHSRT